MSQGGYGLSRSRQALLISEQLAWQAQPPSRYTCTSYSEEEVLTTNIQGGLLACNRFGPPYGCVLCVFQVDSQLKALAGRAFWCFRIVFWPPL